MHNEIHNGQQPRVFYCRHMQPGTALYQREGTLLVDTDGMKNLISSVGKRSIPVYLGHQDVDLDSIKEDSVGVVSDSFYNQNDGWAWFKFVIYDDKGHDAIKQGWSVSNAYLPTKKNGSGTKNNVPYKEEILDGQFTHLAIVPDPRYEGAKIFTPEEFIAYQEEKKKQNGQLLNSKEKKSMFKFFNKVETNTPTDDSLVEVNGELKSWGEIKNALEQEEKSKKQADAKVVINGKEMTVAEAAAAYAEIVNKKKMKKNDESDDADQEGDGKKEKIEESGEDKKGEKKNKKMKKNADDEDEEEDCMTNEDEEDVDEEEEKQMKGNKKEKKNSLREVATAKSDEYFETLQNARDKANIVATPQLVETTADKMQRGKDRYGSGEKKTA